MHTRHLFIWAQAELEQQQKKHAFVFFKLVKMVETIQQEEGSINMNIRNNWQEFYSDGEDNWGAVVSLGISDASFCRALIESNQVDSRIRQMCLMSAWHTSALTWEIQD